MLKKLRRIVLGLVLILLVGGVGLLLVLGLIADRAIGSAIEVAGTETLGVGMTIDQVDLSLLSGGLTLSGMVIDNPPGYQHETLLELKRGVTEIEVKTLLSEKVSIRTLTLQGVDLVMEQKGLSSNLQDVMDMIEMSRASQLARKELEIDTLEITDIRVRVKLLPLPGKMDTVTLKLAPIKMNDLGKDDKLDVGTLSAKLVFALFEGVLDQGVDVLPDDLAAGLFKTLGGTVNLGRKILGETPGAEQILKSAGGLGAGLGKGLRQALGQSKKSDPNYAR